MNLNEYKGSFLFKSPSSSSHSFIPNTAKLESLRIRNRQYLYRVSPLKFLEAPGPWEKTSLGFDVQTNSDHKAQNIKLHSVTASKRYLNEKNQIHGRVMATISKFSPQIFKTYFSAQSFPPSGVMVLYLLMSICEGE